ncbi:MAG: UvrD-helicase domain-containing protein [Prevotellaceae bacterium]|jgi:ATP-dependent exoDNAse (exonuclease V) beta subunit|nr:UvrD-helicase domain-containing protein [Prevotellaceae bacterium]
MGLNIYNASAGSGKTYTITLEYLRWLLSSPAPGAFRGVLAVTFTNKATEEMKSRIVQALNNVAENRDEGLSNSLCEMLRLTPDELTKRATALRTAILHDYSHFAVSTIDKFFQKIIRAFMHEAGLLPEFTVELDTARLLAESVEKLLQDAGQDAALKEWLGVLVKQRIEDGRNWDPRTSLTDIGVEVFKEAFHRLGQEFQEKLKDKKFLTTYVKTLQKITADFEKTMEACANTALQVINEAGLRIDDFKNKKRSFAAYFNKIKAGEYNPGANALKAQNDIDQWYGSDRTKHAQIDRVYTTLNACLTQAIAHYEKNSTSYNTAQQISQNIYSMGLLADIANNVTALSADENIMTISDSLYLLFKLINGNDAPFIYEKTGAFFHSFMLDEFQDTSDMQWNSLKPLLENGLAEGGNALVVGDVKQSIYRWRNGDWRILAYGLNRDLGAFGPTHLVLDTNWRSAQTIVNTNNELFGKLPQLLQQRLVSAFEEAGFNDEQLSHAVTDAYRDAAQRTARHDLEGYVHIAILDHRPEAPASEKALQETRALVAELQSRGYKLSDVGILVRKNTEGEAVAKALLEAGVPVISQDSLFLAHSPAVQFITGLLHQAIHGDDEINRKYIENFLAKKDIPLTSDFDTWLAGLVRQPLAEVIECIIERFKLDELKEETPFVQELHDLMLNYGAKETGDIYSFVDWWAGKGEKQTLAIADEQDAVRILTIHKSKGLQFRVVIIPFCSWPMEPKPNSLLWAKSEEAPFNSLPYLPLNYRKDLANTCFRADYFTEKTQAYIDNLNLLYVAFTRAEDELHVFAFKPGNNSYSVADLLGNGLGNTCFEAGQKLPTVTASHAEKGKTITLPRYPCYPYINRLRLKHREEKYDEEAGASMRDYGILMHRAFSEMKTAGDLEQAIHTLILQGFITNNEHAASDLRQKMEEAMKQPNAAAWFDGSWEVYTEADILLPNTGDAVQQLRPDRVMIKDGKVVVVDYKFGEGEHATHETQVKKYIGCLQDIGYEQVEGYLWYVSKNKVYPVFL